ncbi:MAG: HAMP domain-containing histidine kinase [Sneathiella sp.]|nr:HAMP domain-containing histidine kinase [Sneathiella sp.]
MFGKVISIRYHFLITINLVLFAALFLFGIGFWVEWESSSKKQTEEIRKHSLDETLFNLSLEIKVYEREIQFHTLRMEQLALSFGRSNEFQISIMKSRVGSLNYHLQKGHKSDVFDFANVLDTKGHIVASFPEHIAETSLENQFKLPDSPIRKALDILSGDTPSQVRHVNSSYYLISKEFARDLRIDWVSDKVDFEFALLTVTTIYSDFGDPIGLLILGKLVRNLRDIFIGIQERSKIDYSLYTLKYSSVTTATPHLSPLNDLHNADKMKAGPEDGTFIVEHHNEYMLCREIFLEKDLLAGVGCTGMPTTLANRSLRKIESILTKLKDRIGYWYFTLGVLALSLSTILAFFLSLRITEPLVMVTDAIEKLSRNELNIKLPKKVKSTEIETIVKATEVFKRNIQSMEAVEQKLREQREEALMSNRVKSQFLGNMGHDLRTPLNAIIGFSEVLKGEIYGKIGHDKYKEYSSDIHFSGKHLLELINNILDVSSIECGKFTMHESWFNLPDVINQSKRLHQLLATQANVELKSVINDEIAEFYGDPLRFQQILNNLISNAIKFTPSSKKISVFCALHEGGNIIIKIMDTGTGIPHEDLSTIFEPFFLGDDKTVTSKRGTGLGLFLVKSFADFHHGTVEVESEIGKGTCFTLTFPAKRHRALQEA